MNILSEKRNKYGKFCTLAVSIFVNILLKDLKNKQPVWYNIDIITRILEKVYRYGYMIGKGEEDREDTLLDLKNYIILLREEDRKFNDIRHL